jgi:hypothetical protein
VLSNRGALCLLAVLSNPKRRAHYDLLCLDLLDVEDYLGRYRDLILTASGLGMSLGTAAAGVPAPASSGSSASAVVAAVVATSAVSLQLGRRNWHSLCHASLTAA